MRFSLVAGCLAIVVAVAAGRGSGDAATASSVAAPSQAQQESIAAAAVAQTMPGASAQLVAGPAGTGYTLQITAPSGSIAEPAADDPAFAIPAPAGDLGLYAAAQASWKAELAAGLAASRGPDITSFVLETAGQEMTTKSQNFTHGVLRMSPGDPVGAELSRLGSVPLATLRAQMQSNLDALTSVLPSDTVEHTRIVAIPVDDSSNLYALEVDVKVGAITDLQEHLGDVLQGLATGLVGNANAVVEGVAINVVDDSGRRLGSWQTVRSASGSGVWDSALSLPRVLAVSTQYGNVTGGPDTIMSGQGGGAGR